MPRPYVTCRRLRPLARFLAAGSRVAWDVSLMAASRERGGVLPVEDLIIVAAFGDLDRSVDQDVVEGLPETGSRASGLPASRSVVAWPSPIVVARLLPPKLDAAADDPVTRSDARRPWWARSTRTSAPMPARLDRLPIELHVDPVVAMPGVLEQDVMGLVAGVAPPDDEEDVDVAVAVVVGERDPVSLLQVAGAGRGRSRPRTAVPRRS